MYPQHPVRQHTLKGPFYDIRPKYGATASLFPVDDETLAYMRMTGRSKDTIELAETYAAAWVTTALRKSPAVPVVRYEDLADGARIEADIADVRKRVAGWSAALAS